MSRFTTERLLIKSIHKLERRATQGRESFGDVLFEKFGLVAVAGEDR